MLNTFFTNREKSSRVVLSMPQHVRLLYLIAIYSLIFCIVVVNLYPSITVANNDAQIPILAVAKISEKETVRPGERLQIIIKIKNIGDATAYNVTLKDSDPPDWGVYIDGSLQAFWREVPPGTEIYHTYNISIKQSSTSIIYLDRAMVIYYDANGEKYVVYSEELAIILEVRTGRNIDWADIWRNVVIIESIIILVLILPLIFIEWKTYSEYKREARKKE